MRTAIVAVVFAAAIAVAAGAATTPTTIPDCFSQEVAPRDLVLACGDGNFAFSDLAWTSWGSETATATGEAHANDCNPSCVDGTSRTYPVDVTANGLRTCPSGRRQYTHLEWSSQAKPPPGLANLAGETRFPCSWPLHPGLTATRSAGKVVLTGRYWTASADCPKRVQLTSGATKIADVPLAGTGFRYTWHAPPGRHVVVARQTCGSRTLYEASVVVR